MSWEKNIPKKLKFLFSLGSQSIGTSEASSLRNSQVSLGRGMIHESGMTTAKSRGPPRGKVREVRTTRGWSLSRVETEPTGRHHPFPSCGHCRKVPESHRSINLLAIQVTALLLLSVRSVLKKQSLCFTNDGPL